MENELITKENELENVKTAYFLEDRLKGLNEDYNRLLGQEPRRPSPPNAPQLESLTAKKIPYPPINPIVSMPISTRWAALSAASAIIGMLSLQLAQNVSFIFILLFFPCGVGFLAGLVLMYMEGSAAKKKALEQMTEEIKNSPDYKRKCAEIDEQNKANQEKLDKEARETYLKRCAEYNRAFESYNERTRSYEELELPEWHKEVSELKSVINETSLSLKELYAANIISALLYLAMFMSTSNYDLKFAIERYDTYVMQTAQRKQINIAQAQYMLGREVLQNQEYSIWLDEQMLEISEKGNDVLRSISNWQKSDFAVREYRIHKARRAARKR